MNLSTVLNQKVLMFALLGAVGSLVGSVVALPLTAVTSNESTLISRPDLSPSSDLLPAPRLPALPTIPEQAPPPPLAVSKLVTDAAGKIDGLDVQLTLEWFNHNDLDLHCIPPVGDTIYFLHMTDSVSEGVLDVDQNANSKGFFVDHPVEHIRWQLGKAPPGHYKVMVKYFMNHDAPLTTNFKVYAGIRGSTQENQLVKSGSTSQIGEKQLVYEFDWPPPPELTVPADPLRLCAGHESNLPFYVSRLAAKPLQVVLQGDTGDLQGLSYNLERLSDTSKDTTGVVSIGKLVVKAGWDARPGTRRVKMVAYCPDEPTWRSERDVQIALSPAVLQLGALAEWPLPRGGTSKIPLLVQGGRPGGLVTVKINGDLSGLKCPDTVTIPEGQSETELEVDAEAGSTGTRNLSLVASAGEESSETVAVTVTMVGPPWSWMGLIVTALWTGLLATGLCLALVASQNYYLKRTLVDVRQLLVLGTGGMLAGIVAGGVGQSLFALFTQLALPSSAGFIIGWLLLGGLMGRGVACFIPNVAGLKACAAGTMGGLVSALLFIGIAFVGGDVAGRIAGALLLGASIGLMVCWTEQAFRRAWLEVRHGASETITINLGPEPVKIGSDRSCTVYAHGAAPVALRYWICDGRLLCEDLAVRNTSEVLPDQPRSLGNLTLTVRSATLPSPAIRQDGHARAVPPWPLDVSLAIPILRVTPVAPLVTLAAAAANGRPAEPRQAAARPAAETDSCRGCGHQHPGRKGNRYCIVCDLTY